MQADAGVSRKPSFLIVSNCPGGGGEVWGNSVHVFLGQAHGCMFANCLRTPEDTQSKKVKNNCAKANVHQNNFEEQLACARAACASGTLAGTSSLVAVAIERRKKDGVDTWNMVIRVGGKQKFSFNQKQADWWNVRVDNCVAAGNLVVQKLRKEGLNVNMSIGEMFDTNLRTMCGREPEDIA